MVDGRDRGAIVGAPRHGGSASTFETVARAIAASSGTVRRRIHVARIRARMSTRWGPPKAMAVLATALVFLVTLSQPLPCAASTPTAAARHIAPWADSVHLSALHLSLSHPPCTRARPWRRTVTRDLLITAASSPAPGPVPARRHAIPSVPLADTRAMRAALTGRVGRPLSAAARRAVLQIFLL